MSVLYKAELLVRKEPVFVGQLAATGLVGRWQSDASFTAGTRHGFTL